jgi:hypothetical protein
VHKATKYLSPKLVIKATRRDRPSKRERSVSVVVTIGIPNYRERDFIKKCQRAGESFPVKRIQFQFWPKKPKSK